MRFRRLPKARKANRGPLTLFPAGTQGTRERKTGPQEKI
jgi:hypothetical protein